MKCPVDHAPLCESKRGDFTLTSCGSCHGLWLTRDTLRQAFVSRAPPARLEAFDHQPPLPTSATPRRCPSCHCQLAARWLHGSEIDVCQKCQGVWLDAGELRQVIANHQKRRWPAMAGHKAVASNRESRWHEGLDLPCDADFLTPLGHVLGELASNGVDASQAVAEFLGEALSLLDW